MTERPVNDTPGPVPTRIERVPAPDGIALLVLEGELDLAVGGRFRELVSAAAAEDPRAVVIDATGVGFIDSTVLRELLRAQRELAAAGGRLVIAGAQPTVRRLLQLTATEQLFELVDSREAAFASVT